MSTGSIRNWSERLEDAPIIVPDPIDQLIEELERRCRERQQEQPNQDPTVSLTFVLEHLLEARNRSVKLDRWLTVDQVASPGLGNCSKETVHRKCRNGEIESRINEFNGRREIHIEVVAEHLGKEVGEARASLQEAA